MCVSVGPVSQTLRETNSRRKWECFMGRRCLASGPEAGALNHQDCLFLGHLNNSSPIITSLWDQSRTKLSMQTDKKNTTKKYIHLFSESGGVSSTVWQQCVGSCVSHCESLRYSFKVYCGILTHVPTDVCVCVCHVISGGGSMCCPVPGLIRCLSFSDQSRYADRPGV